MPRKVLEQQARQEQTRKRRCEAGKRATHVFFQFVAVGSYCQVHLGIKATKSEDEEQKQQGKKAKPKSWKYERSEYF